MVHTYLRRTGMPREHIQELRGDSRSEAIDISTSTSVQKI